jgi:hypothetical protein
MRRAIRTLLGRFRKRPRDSESEKAAVEAERELADARRDALLEAQRRDVTRG